MSLTCKENQSTEIDFSNFLSVLASKFLSSLIFRSLSLRGFEIIDNTVTHGLEFYFWTIAKIRNSFSEISQSQLQLVLTWPPSPQHRHVKALTSSFDAMSFPFLIQLQISTFDYIDSHTLVETFRKLPQSERVCVQSCATHRFLDALVYKTKAAEKLKTAYRNVSFPKLRYIYVESTDFDATSIEMLLDCLMERCERYRCFILMVPVISRPMTSKDLKKLLLMLSGMKLTEQEVSTQRQIMIIMTCLQVLNCADHR